MPRLLLALCAVSVAAAAAPKTVSTDRHWKAQSATLKDSTEAE